jgi:murein DD-endopeptidase MepM/ murein hydrolase activator NlpD
VTRGRRVVALAVVAAAAVAAARMSGPRMLLELVTASAPDALAVPVHGVPAAALVDSWNAPRPGGRRHRGIDIFARRGTPVRSPVSGIVLGVGRNRLGGNVVTVLGPGRQVHYFAHLDRFGPVRAGRLIRQGEVVGYVGDTGNARGTPPHLHYGIYAAGGAVNPHPLLTRRDRL